MNRDRGRMFSFREGKIFYKRTTATFTVTFLATIACLVNGIAGQASAALMLFLGLISPLLFHEDMKRNGNLRTALLVPAFGLLSVVWSNHPSNTVYYSIQLLLTFSLAAAMASLRELSTSVRALFYAHILFGIVSLPFGQTVLWEDGQYVFVGLSVAKNAYGGVNFFIVALGVYMTHCGLSKRKTTDLALGIFGIILGFVGVLVSRSTGALLSVICAIALYSTLVGLSNIRRQTRVMALLVVFVSLVILLAVSSPFWDDIYYASLHYFGKSSDLTGRTDLWLIADKLISRDFWIGVGAFGFWVQGDPLPEAIWSINGILGRSGFNFHNTYREIMVHLGIVGLLVHILVFGTLLIRQFRYVIFTKSREHYVYFCILFSLIIRMPYESIMPLSPVYPVTIFMIASLALRPPIKNPSQRRAPYSEDTGGFPIEIAPQPRRLAPRA